MNSTQNAPVPNHYDFQPINMSALEMRNHHEILNDQRAITFLYPIGSMVLVY